MADTSTGGLYLSLGLEGLEEFKGYGFRVLVFRV